jgi:hypothetical protein
MVFEIRRAEAIVRLSAVVAREPHCNTVHLQHAKKANPLARVSCAHLLHISYLTFFFLRTLPGCQHQRILTPTSRFY